MRRPPADHRLTVTAIPWLGRPAADHHRRRPPGDLTPPSPRRAARRPPPATTGDQPAGREVQPAHDRFPPRGERDHLRHQEDQEDDQVAPTPIDPATTAPPPAAGVRGITGARCLPPSAVAAPSSTRRRRHLLRAHAAASRATPQAIPLAAPNASTAASRSSYKQNLELGAPKKPGIAYTYFVKEMSKVRGGGGLQQCHRGRRRAQTYNHIIHHPPPRYWMLRTRDPCSHSHSHALEHQGRGQRGQPANPNATPTPRLLSKSLAPVSRPSPIAARPHPSNYDRRCPRAPRRAGS